MIQALAYIISVKVETCSFVDILPWISHISSLTLIPYGVKVSIAAFQVGGRGSNTCVGETHVRFCILIFMCQVTGNYLGHALKKIFLAIMVFILSFIGSFSLPSFWANRRARFRGLQPVLSTGAPQLLGPPRLNDKEKLAPIPMIIYICW